jgi:hypothetical protein
VCVSDGYPLVEVPGANVFYTDHDLSTPQRPDGSRAISCKQVSVEQALRDLYKAGTLLDKVVASLP